VATLHDALFSDFFLRTLQPEISNMTEQDVPAEVASASLRQEKTDSPVAETVNVMEKERPQCETNEQQNDLLQELEIAGTAGSPQPETDSKTASEEQKPNLVEPATNSNDLSLSAHTTTQLPNELPTAESLLQSVNEFSEPILPLNDPTVVPMTDMSQLSEVMNGLIAAYSKPKMDFDQGWQQPLNGHAEPYSSENEQHALPPTGFAKLEFPDGHFYMTTYAVELGRDMRAYKYARRQAMIEGGVAATTRPQRSASLGDTPQTPGKGVMVNGSASIARSFVSESGGIIGEEDGHFILPNEKRRRKKNTKKSKSTDSGLTQVSRKHSIDIKDVPLVDSADTIAPATVDPNATAKLNPSEHMGDPHYTPLIPIHPPFDPSNPGKGISRKHVKIFYNFDTGRFEMEVLGRNGAFHDDQHYAQGSVVPLHDGSDIQIGGVNLTFVLPTVPVDDGQGEPSESVSGRMSFTFEDGRGESVIASEESDDNCYESYDDALLPHPMDAYDYEEDDDDESVEQSIEQTSEEDEDDDEEHETKRVMTKLRRGRPKKHPMQDLPSKNATSRSANDSNKRRTKIKITMSKRQRAKAQDQERSERRAAERRAREKVRMELATKAAKARRDSTKENIHDTTRGPPKEAAKEPSKTSIGSAQIGEQEKPARLARDEAMQNGVDFFDPKLPPGFVVPPRKKGPGRPPKDGVMSKREKALLIRQAKEEEKARKMGLDPTKLPPPEPKLKTQTRRNSKGEIIEEKRDENGDEQKSVRPPRPPRSPSPEMKIEDYTEEQMQRPNANYVILIYEAIKGSKTGRMNLQQIYSAIERRYPFFKFKVTSSGWQSSVRHNLSQHDVSPFRLQYVSPTANSSIKAFVQVEKDGKGWLWGIKEGVPIERERRKKTPPPQQPSTQHPPPNRFPQQPYPFNGYPSASNRAPQHGTTPSYTYQPSRFFPPSLSQSTEAKSQSYSSPYASDKPAEGTNASTTASSGLTRSSYAPPSYTKPPSYAPPLPTSTASTTPPLPQNTSSSQSQQLTKLSGSRTYRPSADVVETFRKVFVDSYQRKALGMTPSDALEMVNRAIKRVLEPDSVTSMQGSADEMTVALAFENCIAKSQGPPRHIAPTGVTMGTGSTGQGQGGGRESPTLATSIATSAAITAAEKTVPQNQGQGVRSTTPTEPAPAEQQDDTNAQSQPQPQRPAEANLLNLLTSTPTTSSPRTVAQVVSDDRTPTPGSLDSAKVNGIARILEHASRLNGMGITPMRPDIEPLTPPAPSLTPQPQIGAKRGAEEDGKAALKRVKVNEKEE
jgi:hypothetical protein